MGSIIQQRSFEAGRDTHEPPLRYSLDREPWRAFRPSLAVQFTSRRRGGWSADRLSDRAKAEILSGLEARSAIISRYARIQSLVRDLVANAGYSTSFGGEPAAYSASREKALRYARKLTTGDGPQSVCPQMLNGLFDRIEETAPTAEFVTSGFVKVHEEKNGAICFRIQQWGRRQSFKSEDLRALAVALERAARELESQLAAPPVLV